MTFAWRRTACGMRHCCARRIGGCLGRRKLGCTTTRQAERQRIIGAEANRIAVLNAATPRAGSSIGKHKSFSRKGWQCKRLSFGRSHRPFSFSGKKMGGVVLRRARRTSLRAARGESVKYLLDKKSPAWYADHNKRQRERSLFFSPAQERGRPVQVPAERKRRRF